MLYRLQCVFVTITSCFQSCVIVDMFCHKVLIFSSYVLTALFIRSLVLQASSTVIVGSFVWVEDPEEAWIDGEVIEVNGEEIKVQCTSGKTVCITDFRYTLIVLIWIVSQYFCWKFFKVVVKVSNTHPKDLEVPPSGVTDMTTLAYLHEPGVLQNLKSRYYIDEIYVSFLLLAPFYVCSVRHLA